VKVGKGEEKPREVIWGFLVGKSSRLVIGATFSRLRTEGTWGAGIKARKCNTSGSFVPSGIWKKKV